MMAKVDCSLNIYEAKANNVSSTPAAVGGGVIEMRIRLRYQLRIKVPGIKLVVDDIVTPEFRTPFAMPVTFLFPELSEMHVSNMLAGLNVEARVRDLVSPRIAKFAVDVAKRQGSQLSGNFMTVAEISIKKIDYIRKEEFARISRTL